MRFSCNRVCVILSFLCVILFILNLFLLWTLNNDQPKNNRKSEPRATVKRLVQLSSLKADESREYRVLENALTAERTFKEEDITLITHCTFNHLHHLIQLTARWSGPVSVAVFVMKVELDFVSHLINGLRECHKRIKKRVTFHIVLPAADFVGDKETVLDLSENIVTNCEEFLSEKLISSQQRQNYANIKIPYPNNLLRNVAWRSSKTNFILVVDIDMLCSLGLRQSFMEFAARNNLLDKPGGLMDVYVVPAFEINNSNIPDDKESLLVLWDDGMVQPFYYKICEKCQRNTDYERWKRAGSSPQLDISYSVEWKDPWEPFYIAPKTIPFYDERFRQYGFNRISQVCETHVAGYNFHVLNNAFLVHQGFKTKDGFHAQKDAENQKNKIIFRQLKEELKSKYPSSSRRCY